MEGLTIFSMVFTALLGLGCLFLILSPFFQLDGFLYSATKTAGKTSLKEALFTTLNEIEFEYKMDKISEKDYMALKGQYENQLAGIIKEEETLSDQQADKDILAEVEKEIEAAMQSFKTKKGEGK